MSNNNQSSVEWLINEIERRVSIIQSEPQTMARELMIDNLAVDLEQAKVMQKEEQEQLSARWAKLREQTKDAAMAIGVRIGFELALQHYEDYYEQLNRTDLDEDDFMRDYISKIDKQYKQ